MRVIKCSELRDAPGTLMRNLPPTGICWKVLILPGRDRRQESNKATSHGIDCNLRSLVVGSLLFVYGTYRYRPPLSSAIPFSSASPSRDSNAIVWMIVL